MHLLNPHLVPGSIVEKGLDKHAPPKHLLPNCLEEVVQVCLRLLPKIPACQCALFRVTSPSRRMRPQALEAAAHGELASETERADIDNQGQSKTQRHEGARSPALRRDIDLRGQLRDADADRQLHHANRGVGGSSARDRDLCPLIQT